MTNQKQWTKIIESSLEAGKEIEDNRFLRINEKAKWLRDGKIAQ